MSLPDWPTYTSLHVLHCSLYMPLGFVLTFFLVSCCCVVLWGLKAIFRLVSLNKFVILLIAGLKYLKVTHFFLSGVLSSLLCVLFAIFLLMLSNQFLGYPLFLPMVKIVFHSLCLASSEMGSVCILCMWYLKAAVLCSLG